MRYFITGTDTDAGKTYVSCLLIEALKAAGKSVAGYKPFACGDNHDSLALQKAAGGASIIDIDEVTPVLLDIPASPYAAAVLDDVTVDVDAARKGFLHLATKFEALIVEGAGGWEVPLWGRETMADFAASLALPVIVVVNNKLGCLNHAILTVRNIQARGLTCAGIILNHAQEGESAVSLSNRMVLEEFLDVPVLAEVRYGDKRIENFFCA